MQGNWVDGVSWWRGPVVEERASGGEGLEVIGFREVEALLLEGLLREKAKCPLRGDAEGHFGWRVVFPFSGGLKCT